jgi:hypothetical protein
VFVVAALNDENFTDLVAVGLAILAAAFVARRPVSAATWARDDSGSAK